MGSLIYSMNVSLDGYVETIEHGLDWVAARTFASGVVVLSLRRKGPLGSRHEAGAGSR